MKKQIFSEKLITWYHRHRRELPWRNTKNPYQIWLSEVILQQTRVAQGLPYYEKFVRQYPTVKDLAAADEREVLRLWQGLGYYSRARNMHETARFVIENLDGKFPESYKELLQLKGIGSYTAAAIASFAFNEKVAVLDGNVYRVLARIFGETTDISSNEAKKIFGKLANDLLPNEDSATHNQAIMEFGAMQCTPANPECMFCPFSEVCVANLTGQQAILPVKLKKTKVRKRFFNYLVIQQKEKFYLKQRLKNDIWAGLFDFYLIENDVRLEFRVESSEFFLEKIKKQIFKFSNFQIKNESEIFRHVLTHQRIEAKFWHIEILENADFILPDFQPYSLPEIEDLPKPILINNYLKKYHFLLENQK